MLNPTVLLSIVLVIYLAPIHVASSQSVFDASLAGNVDTVRIVASGQWYTPRQSVAPGGQPRHTSDYDVTVTWNPGAWQAHEEWEMHTIYPLDNELSFTMTYRETAGIKGGRDSFLVASEPGPIAGARIGANFKELWIANPIILSAYAEALPATEYSQGGVTLQRVVLSAHDTEWVMVIDPDSGLPLEMTTLEADPNNAQAPNRAVFSDWREVSGVPFPFQVEQYLNGQLLRREIRSAIEVNPRNAARQLQLPDDLEDTDEALRDWGWSMSHLLLARAGLGGPSDTPQIDNVELNEVGPDIYQIAGGSHNGLAIVGPDGIAVVDAPWFPERSATVLEILAERWPGLPVRYIILTHHHIDHTGGFRGFVEAGATLVASEGAVPFYEEALTLAGHPSTSTVAVGDHATLEGIGRTIEVYDIPNSHSDATVAAYVPDAKLIFNADLFSPGRDLQFELWMAEFFASVEYHGLDVERHVGGHGSYGPTPQ